MNTQRLSLSGLEPRVAEAVVKDPVVPFEDSADELHSRAGAMCCCLDSYTRVGTPASKIGADPAVDG